jgi:hypothetical protein
MLRRIPRLPRLPLGGSPDLLLFSGVAYFAWQHEQGRHQRPHVLCMICWLNKVAPEAPSGSSEAEPPPQA